MTTCSNCHQNFIIKSMRIVGLAIGTVKFCDGKCLKEWVVREL